VSRREVRAQDELALEATVCLGDLIEGDPLGDARPDGASRQQAEEMLQVLAEPGGMSGKTFNGPPPQPTLPAVRQAAIALLPQHAVLAVDNEIGWSVGNVAAANGLRTPRSTLMAPVRIWAFGTSRTSRIVMTAILRSRG
jgi:hypothetical protein